MSWRIVLVLTLSLIVRTLAGAAEAPNPAEVKLRESLRNTMLQMRTLQGERDTLQTEKENAEAEKKGLAEKLEILTKESAVKEAALEKSLAETNDKLALQMTSNTQLLANIDKWKAAHKEVSALAEKREAARAKLNSEKVALQRRCDDQMRKNQEMFKISGELLTRYENFGLGTALTAREPFVGLTRVRLQNLVQDYADKVQEQRIKP